MTRVDWHHIAGVELHDGAVHDDSRGNFVKLWSADPLAVDQVCTSFNRRSGTIRGLHLQLMPSLERKFVWCTSGELWDVLLDTRQDQPTYGAWTAIRLEAAEPALLEVPRGVAHGYQTLRDSTGVAYLISGDHDPTCARTIAWDDPTLGITWPLEVSEISAGDRNGTPWPLS